MYVLPDYSMAFFKGAALGGLVGVVAGLIIYEAVEHLATRQNEPIYRNSDCNNCHVMPVEREFYDLRTREASTTVPYSKLIPKKTI